MYRRLLTIAATLILAMIMITTVSFAGTVATSVSDDEELLIALEKGEDVVFSEDIEIDPATLSNAYGTTGINVKQGQSIDGGGHTLDIAGAGGTWDSGINTTGGTIKNIKITGSFRGIFINHNSDHSETVILDNVVIDGTTYTISCDQGMQQNLEATNSTFNGWTSYAATIGKVSFTKCNFGEGNGYAFIRPYAPTTFTNCVFEEGYEMDATRTSNTLVNCYVGDTLITSSNITELLGSDAANATVDNYEEPKLEVEIPTVDTSKPVEDVEVGTDKEAKDVLEDTSSAIIESILNGAQNIENIDKEVVDAIKEAIDNRDEVEVTTKVEVTPVEEKDLESTFSKEDLEKVEAAAGEKTIVQYLDLNVYMTVVTNGVQTAEGKITELTEEITFTIAIPEELKNTEDGVTRVYYIVRVHNGVAELLPVTVNEDGTLSFTTDRFSTYALTYEDEVDENDNATGTPDGDGTEDDKKQENAPQGDTSKVDNKEDDSKEATTNREVSKTSDSSNLMLWLTLMLTAALATAVLKKKIS